MTLLAIDTTGPDCSAALRIAGRADLVVSEAIGRGHAERLAPMVAGLLAEAGLVPRDLTRIGVTVGPGSFAGTRVGTAFARGLALACGVPAVGISNLAVMARMAPQRPLAVLHDARRGEVILQAFHNGAAVGSDAERVAVAGLEARIRDHAGPAAHIAGSGADLLASGAFADTGVRAVSLPALLDLVAQADPAGAPPSPFYARPPDAKLPGGREPA